MKEKGLKRAIEIYKYSDSEPNEVFTAVLHSVVLPLALYTEMLASPLLLFGSILCGLFQAWAVLWEGSLKYRDKAVKLAALISIATVLNYFLEGMLIGSNVGWLLVMVWAFWNVYRIQQQRHIEEIRAKYESYKEST